MRFVLILALLCIAAPAPAGIPCEILTAWVEGEPQFAVISPGGGAPSLTEQGIVIHVEIMDCTYTPIANFPFQDIWVSDIGNGELNICQGGSVADANTGEDGQTTISGHIFGGDHTENGTMVYVNGLQVENGPLPLDFVSPDINGDLIVNLNDFSLFGMDYSTTAPRSDLVHNGLVDLADFARFGQHYGEQCP